MSFKCFFICFSDTGCYVADFSVIFWYVVCVLVRGSCSSLCRVVLSVQGGGGSVFVYWGEVRVCTSLYVSA